MKLPDPLPWSWFYLLHPKYLAAYVSAWSKYRAAVHGKATWRCYRYGGGGSLETPRPMTEMEATSWLARVIQGDVAYIDREYKMIFYRPRGF